MLLNSNKAPNQPVCFECISNSRILRADTDWWDLYHQTFPQEEQEPPQAILDSLDQGVGLAFRVSNKEKTIGLATVHLLTNPSAVFLVYLAIDPAERRKQIGAHFFDYIYQTGAAKLKEMGYRSVGFVWEITASQNPNTQEATALARKINFFEQNGGTVLPYKYFQPPINGSAAVPMHVMFRPGDEGVTLEATNPAALIQAMYCEKYAAINYINPELLEELLEVIST
ncbi:GNAT family N-acetyltransferase [Adhaeribacter arboris]|nr:GNAT family N-acetyltransferase [Adhaeribacter arboris]